MAVSMADNQHVLLTATEKDGAGNDVQPSDVLQWSSDDNGAVVALNPSADGMTCDVVAVAMGTANVTVSDPALSLTSAAEEITVTAGAAASIEISAGEPADVSA